MKNQLKSASPASLIALGEGMGKFTAISLMLYVALSMQVASAERIEVASLSSSNESALQDISYQTPTAFQSSSLNRGFLEESDLAIGSILKSRHFRKVDYYNYNETHGGIYINVNTLSMGTYKNSANVQSTFITYNPNLYQAASFKVNLVAGVANGYERWQYAQGDYLPILGVSAQWRYLKTMLAPDSVAFGLEFPLN